MDDYDTIKELLENGTRIEMYTGGKRYTGGISGLGHSWTFGDIFGQLGTFWDIWGMWDIKRHQGTFMDHKLWIFVDLFRHLRTSRDICRHLRTSRGIFGHLEQLGTFLNMLEYL